MKANPRELTCYQCQECKVIYADPKIADKCCSPRYCEDCGVEVKKYQICCEPCGLKRQFEKAEKLEHWDGCIYSEHVAGYNDGYFRSIDELTEYCYENDTAIPPWAFICKEQRYELDIDGAIERMTEDAYEDAVDDLMDVAELQEFIQEWNAKQNIITYYPDCKKVVLINDDEKS